MSHPNGARADPRRTLVGPPAGLRLALVASLALARPAASPAAEEAAQDAQGDPHEQLFLENVFPPAASCAGCHPVQYEQWSVSPHAYSQVSPVFNAMQATIASLTNGTNGDFCIRCHTPIGMYLAEPLLIPNEERHAASREGVTCVQCHRVSAAYGKISGRVAVDTGDIFDPVKGPTGGEHLEEVLANPNEYAVKTSRDDAKGRDVHLGAERFFQLTTPAFCGTCHDVTLLNGFRLEEAYSSYRASPAARQGVTCQDCHMGLEHGVASGYAEGPAAVLGTKETPPRKLTNHMFIGPDYSLVHPGIFPHDVEAAKLASISEWLQFDWEAGWGVREAEKALPDDHEYPDTWRSSFKRRKARRILERHFELLRGASDARREVLRAGYQLGDVVVKKADASGLRFKVEIRNATDGHTVPVGFIGERVIYLEVTVRDAAGAVIYRSGDRDPNGDLRDLHSLYVHDGLLPLDRDLLSLQSKFLTTNVRGSEREQVLSINYSPDPLPFLRPSTFSSVLTGRPGGSRLHRTVIPPDGRRWGKYEVSRKQLTGRPPYTASIRLWAGMVPVNLINEIQGVGFDYGMTPAEIGERLVDGLRDWDGTVFTDGYQVLWEREVVLEEGARSSPPTMASVR